MPGLRLPKRTAKPRQAGITSLNDKGIGLHAIEDLVHTAGDYVDLVKFHNGSAETTLHLEDKLKAYANAGIQVFFGGTLFEAYLYQGDLSGYKVFLKAHDIQIVEVSSGTIDLSPADKARIIMEFARDFVVLSEVGSKDADRTTPPHEWIAEMRQALEAGAWKVITEGRDQGTVGLYNTSGEVRVDLVDEILRGIPAEHIIFEAPTEKQQIWLINKIGPNVNLGNVPPGGVLVLETQRVGLRYDTFHLLGQTADEVAELAWGMDQNH